MNLQELLVDNMKHFSDHRGDLLPVEFSDLPFLPQRMFITIQSGSFDGEKRVRGKHANKTCQQYFYCITGEVDISLFDGKEKHHFSLRAGQGLFVDKMIWNQYLNKSPIGHSCVYVVLASHPYDGSDYITNIDEFMKITSV